MVEGSKVELRHIQSFVLLARHGSFSRTAAALGVAQPALSQRMKQLEDELGVELVNRSTRPLRLTQAGATFLVRAERILAEAELAAEEMRGIAQLDRGRVMVGTLPALGALWLPRILGIFRALQPGVQVVVRERNTQELARMVGLGELDLAVLHEVPGLYGGEGSYPGIEIERLFVEELMVVAALNHPLASRRSVRLGDLADEDWITVTRGSGLAHTVNEALAEAGIEPRVVATCDSQAVLRAMVAAGVGIAIMSRVPAQHSSPALVAIPIDPPLPAHTTAVAWRADSPFPQAARALIEVIRQQLDRQTGEPFIEAQSVAVAEATWPVAVGPRR